MKNNLKRGTNDWNQDAQMAGLLATQIFSLHDELPDAKLSDRERQTMLPHPHAPYLSRDAFETSSLTQRFSTSALMVTGRP